jgi:hypothetical protein
VRGACWRAALVVAAAAALAAVPGTRPAWAGGQTQPLAGSGDTLVPGSAPLPEFHLDFILDDPAGHSVATPGNSGNLEIALTSPDSGVFRFLFSPRPQFGLNLDRTAGNRGYAGLTWNLFDGSHLFGNFGLAGSYADPGAPNDPLHRPLGPPLMLQGALELGYHIGTQHSLSLSLDQGRAPAAGLGGETSDNLRLRYGLRF